MRLHTLKPPRGARKSRKRSGRGIGSGRGKTAGRGTKGQKAREGSKFPPTFEGGQTPLFRRLPKRGFNNKRFRTEYAVVNVGELQRFDAGTEIDPDFLQQVGLVKKLKDGVKILGEGDLDKELKVRAHAFSNSAARKIEAAGGNVEVI